MSDRDCLLRELNVRAILVLIIGLAATSAASETYKWVDERGVTTYGTKPPVGRPAQLVDTRPLGPTDLPAAQQKRVEDNARRRADLQAQQPPNVASAPAPAAAAPKASGMAFDTYIRLERGMSEGELLLRAGQPDQVSVENLRSDVVKSFYYCPTSSDPFITVVTVRGGRIAQLERTRKF